MQNRVVIALVLLVVTFAHCSREPPQTTSCAECAPIILYAVDGLEWSVLQPLIEQGRMPVMAGLMQRGSYGYLETIEPTFSPVIWTTMATGKLPKDHGIEGFVYRVGPGEDGQRFYTSGHRTTKAFWNILSDYGRTVDCLGWWMTYPVEKINGVMVAQTNTTAVLHSDNALLKGTVLRGVEDQVYPPEKQDQVMDILDDVDHSLDSTLTDMFGGVPHPTTAFTKLLWEQSQWAFRADALYLRVAKKLLESGQRFDMLAVYVSGTDVAAHRFWQYTYPQEFEHPPIAKEIADFGHVLPDYYAYVDRALGNLLLSAPKNTTVIVVSDHGFHAVNPERVFKLEDIPEDRLSGNHMDAPPAVFIAAGPNIAHLARGATPPPPDREHPIGHAWDMLPTLLALEGIPLGEDFYGKPMTNIIDPDFLKKVPIRTVKTHDDKAWDEARQARMKEASDRAERLEQLRSLGYIK